GPGDAAPGPRGGAARVDEDEPGVAGRERRLHVGDVGLEGEAGGEEGDGVGAHRKGHGRDAKDAPTALEGGIHGRFAKWPWNPWTMWTGACWKHCSGTGAPATPTSAGWSASRPAA